MGNRTYHRHIKAKENGRNFYAKDPIALPKSIKRFKERVRELASRDCGRSIWQVIQKLNDYIRGWWAYYHRTETRSFLL
ncbi:MAG: hypothetical protein IIC50_17235 [Planctomycetes bacterium]|nr:hypothetical protein [Planctomycetota bacterium]